LPNHEDASDGRDADNLEVIERLRDNGDDLSKERPIDFFVVFESPARAEMFCVEVARMGGGASVNKREDGRWDGTATFHMIPAVESIGNRERELEDLAEALGGELDGWGCFSVE